MVYVLIIWGLLGEGSSPVVVAHYQSKEACQAAGAEWAAAAMGPRYSEHYHCLPAAR